MSTEMETEMESHSATSFYGGMFRGVCLQITTRNIPFCKSAEEQIQQPGYIHLTISEARALRDTLDKWLGEK